MIKESCGNCKYCITGECHKNPPVFINDIDWGWVPTNGNAWCGEWEPNQEIAKEYLNNMLDATDALYDYMKRPRHGTDAT